MKERYQLARETEFHIRAQITPRVYRMGTGVGECIVIRFGTQSRILIFPSSGVTIEDLEHALAAPLAAAEGITS